MSSSSLRRLLAAFVVLLVPIAWLATRFDPYQIDGDAVAYMDLADLIRAHAWHGVVNGYWHPLYPALLALGRAFFHPSSRMTELPAFYAVNYAIFLLEVAAIWAFTGALIKLRRRSTTPDAILSAGDPLLSLEAMRLLGLGLLIVASQRELSMGKVRPDALLQALMLFAFAALLRVLASESSREMLAFAPLVGVCFGLAYLTKSFAFAVGLLSLLLMGAFAWRIQRRSLRWAAASLVLAAVPFALIAGPYVAALSHKYGHLDFGDSGALNYAWYAGDTEKMHLEPSMTAEFGTADVHLIHPEQQLLTHPGVYSYRAVPLGTYPDWFDPSYFNQGVKPHVKLGPLLRRDKRNVVLVLRYVLNHPEALVLLALLLFLGARLRSTRWRRGPFWLPVVLIGTVMWLMYGLVNIEERYVTLAYLLLVLPLFAALREPELSATETAGSPRRMAAVVVAVFAFLALGESLRVALEERRYQSGAGALGWQSPEIFDTARALSALGLHSGDEIACMGVTACLHDHYWARLANLRITTEIYAPDNQHLAQEWASLDDTDRQHALAALKGQGAKVLVAEFPYEGGPPQTVASTTHAGTAAEDWVRLGNTSFFYLPLTITPAPQPAAAPHPWVSHAAGNQ